MANRTGRLTTAVESILVVVQSTTMHAIRGTKYNSACKLMYQDMLVEVQMTTRHAVLEKKLFSDVK